MRSSLVIVGLLWAGVGFGKTVYLGDFKKLSASKGCESIFDEKFQDVTLVLQRESDIYSSSEAWMYFSDPYKSVTSIFDGTSFNGTFIRGSRILLASSGFKVGKNEYFAEFDGIADPKFLFGTMTVSIVESKSPKNPICTAKAEYSSRPE